MNTWKNEQYTWVETFVRKRLPLWVVRLDLRHWDINPFFLDTLYIDDPVTDNYLVTATTECRWNYLQAKIYWYLPSAVRHGDDEIERVLVHELCHVVLSPEQSLIEPKIEAAQLEVADPTEKDLVGKLMNERMELATEQMTKSVMAAWGD